MLSLEESYIYTRQDFTEYLSVVRHCQDSSIATIEKKLGYITEWLKEQSLELSTRNFEKFLYSKKQAGANNNQLNSFIMAYATLINYYDYRDIPHSLKKLKSYPKTHPEWDILSKTEIEAILNTTVVYGKFRGVDSSFLNITYSAFSRFLALTGCRFTEASKIQVKDLDLLNGVVVLKNANVKYGEGRRVWIHEPLLSQLKSLCAMKNTTDYVFTGMTGKPIISQGYSDDLRQRAKLAGIHKRVHPHLFRHSYATQLLKDKVPIEYVTKLIGHKSIETTYENYVHLANTDLEEASKKHVMVRPYQPHPKQLDDFYDDHVIPYGFDPTTFELTHLRGKRIIIELKNNKE